MGLRAPLRSGPGFSLQARAEKRPRETDKETDKENCNRLKNKGRLSAAFVVCSR
jgi:hypothetical protein